MYLRWIIEKITIVNERPNSYASLFRIPSGPLTIQQQNRADLPGSAQLLTQTVIFISNPKNVSPYFGLKTFELLDDW